jgi:hypothetical protein
MTNDEWQRRQDRKLALAEEISHKRNQSGKFVRGFNIFLDDVKRAIVKPAETPDGQREQDDCLPIRIIQEKQDGGDESDEQKQQSFDFYPGWVGQIFHKANQLRCSGVSAERRK